MKQVIRLTENELHTLINESVKKVLSEGINELSPEFLNHASDVAINNNRYRQNSIFKKGAKDAWNRDYGFEDADGAYINDTVTPSKYNFNMRDKNTPELVRTKDDYTNYYNDTDDINSIANNRLKPAHRNKVMNGLKSAENMRNGLDPQGNPYPTK